MFGTYVPRLRRDGRRWRISAITLDTRWQTGDSSVLQAAAVAVSDATESGVKHPKAEPERRASPC
jgi:hypothetical protein